MARREGSQIWRALTSLLSPRWIRRRARQLGVVKRERKVDVVALVAALVLGFDGAQRRTIAGFRRAYELATGTTLAPSAFYERLTPELAALLRELTFRALEKLGRQTGRMQLALSAFIEVFVADGSLVRLGDALEPWYPSVFTNHTKASAKVHVVMDARTRTPRSLELHPGSRHDVTILSVGPWVKGRLLVLDLAYYQGKLFTAIAKQHGYFLCRLKAHANFKVLASDKRRHVGRRLKEVIENTQGKPLDVEVDFAYRRARERDYDWRHLRVRVVGDWHEEEQRHRLYVTNARRTQLAAKHVAGIYALRWEVELLFRELKSAYRIDEMPTANKSAAECLLYAALLTLAVSRRLRDVVVGRQRGVRQPFPFERWATLFGFVARDLLALLLAPRRHRPPLSKRLAALLLHEAQDPNRSRLLLATRAQLGVLQPCSAPP
jgi:putative transposase